ncbi:MAG: hydantoinase B/oxoprolinase family protein [Gammaproteobacteria bacterium]
MAKTGWKFWIDRGGTFTDVVGCAPDNSLQTLKLLSDDPQHYQDAAAEGIRRMLEQHGGGPVLEIRMGTTVATNALLERTGARTGLLTTQGFRDVLEIGNQNRPKIFDLHIRKPEMLYRQVAETAGRINAAGRVLKPLDEQNLKNTFSGWQQAGIESVAICFLHAWCNPAHEQRAAELARAAGFNQVSVSSELSPTIKFVGRSHTTVVDAYLSPVLLKYVQAFRTEIDKLNIGNPRILFMQSNGGLISGDQFRGKDSILSGPAGGVVGMAAAAARAGQNQLIGFDMGGTSTDVSLFTGTAEISTESLVEGLNLRSPAINIHTIAAGGGSILKFADGRLQAGPESAGAEPGPMSYGKQGPLTITDANVLLGRVQAGWFPSVFGPHADQPLNTTSVSDAFDDLAAELTQATGTIWTPEATAEGFLNIATDNMANAVRQISIRRGTDPGDFTLCSFGGAGGQHACRVADELGMTRILLDPYAPVLSAWGMGAAAVKTYRQQSINLALQTENLTRTRKHCHALEEECRKTLEQQDATPDQVRHIFYLRVTGSDTSLPIEGGSISELQSTFESAHKARFGFTISGGELEIDSIRVEAESFPTTDSDSHDAQLEDSPATTELNARVFIGGHWQNVPVYPRASLHPSHRLAGPALVVESHSTTVVETGWSLEVNAVNQLMLNRTRPADETTPGSTVADPVRLEIFNNHFMQIAEEMGVVLQKTARSVNIKERMDFSCALFTANGDLIANAPHVPVHLGSMDDSVKTLLQQHPKELSDGVTFIANAPYNGGTHLPDVTVITPVCMDAELKFIVAARAHHADIGGISPGSMPPVSKHIDEEGVIFDNQPLVQNGSFLETEIRQLLTAEPYPARNPDQNIADIRAQIAANERGRRLLLRMIERHSETVVAAYTRHVQDNAEESVRNVISRLGEGRFTCEFDNGQQICVDIRIDHDNRNAIIDFTGTSPVADNNLNAPSSVCQAAVLYVFRTLVQADIPLNAGCRKPLRLIIPEGCMLNPNHPAAVVGGNVETSQIVTDTLYGALGVLAGSQGTMNNLSFGNQAIQYYETICGGAGAGENFPGADAVQTHMTNSRMTDTEILETRYPILIQEFSVRDDSGGEGKFWGGNGVTRKIEFRDQLSAAILSNHRRIQPFGLAEGNSGQAGKNSVIRTDGRVEEYNGIMMTEVHKGDVLVIETPGGGGYGAPIKV